MNLENSMFAVRSPDARDYTLPDPTCMRLKYRQN